jgi:hypothetical protein
MKKKKKMTLPTALQARLLNRGIIKKKTNIEINSNEEVEEIICESYDEPTTVNLTFFLINLFY